MKKIIAIYIAILAFTACTKDFDTINDDPKNAPEVPAATLFSNAERNLVDNVNTPEVNTNVFRLMAQYWAQTTYADESQYNIDTRNIPRNFWNAMYTDVLRNFSEADSLIKADTTFLDPQQKINQLAVNEILTVYSWSVLVNIYGNIPYSQALDYREITPKYDDAATIYADLLTRLDEALTSLDTDSESFGSADLIYGGNVSKWIKFGNSLKLRLAMTVADVESFSSTVKTAVESAAPNVFTSNDDNALLNYLQSPPNTNPVWVQLIQSGRTDYVASNTILNIMKPLADPRLPSYFNPETETGQFLAGTYGNVNSTSGFSLPSDKLTSQTFPGVLLDYSEVEFYLAEAVERGYTVGGTAAEHYNKAVTASITYWGGTSEQATVYLAKPQVNYTTAAGDYKQKIGTQKWLALYNRGIEGWTEYRRLDAPTFNEVEEPQGDFPLRFTYSDQERNLNRANYSEAAQAIGGDEVTTRIFWDKF
ncbi:SusD/RagB family nutrient-binding outer membrane lipoprotein [Cytophagaceae bacterium YF14B1]|uniref:SusD/RagB family nutrient-binding outer membrane lipoprotein n=1 Tax=Xanthocytophaga flava TaxID=3048013 RepID=A0AAE3QMJ6_9BACT|nr:SusD/RagB family nutrient-binding outer membrane lipoprotein [Xanthocytophaga flavus]MDJ1479815.1 SusD/RagB family nutrient-binding outer membrane lipoprotein [Xanthocytophaga flavus]